MLQKRTGAWVAVAVAVVVVLVAAWAVAASRTSPSTGPGAPMDSPAPAPGATSPDDSGTGLPTGSHAYTMEWGGFERTYRVFVPSGLSGPAPLVVMIHGGGGSGQQAEQSYGWDRLAEREHIIVAYPDALGPVIHAWNVDGVDDTGTPCCGRSGRDGVDDVGFVLGMVKAIAAATPIDPNRVYAAGVSNGGILSYTLACESDVFAAIGPVAGTMLTDCADPHPTSVLHIHGLADSTIPFDGSRGDGPASIDGPSIESVLEAWRVTDGCGSAAVSTAGVVASSIAACAEGRTVELVTIADGEHGWPGAPLKPGDPEEFRHQPSQALDATTTLWEFFVAHPKG